MFQIKRKSREEDSEKTPSWREALLRRETRKFVKGFLFEGSSVDAQNSNARVNDTNSALRNTDTNNNQASLVQDYNSIKLREVQLSSKITTLKSELVYLRKMLVKSENDLKLKTAKVNKVHDEAIDMLVELIGKKAVNVDTNFISLSLSQSQSSNAHGNLSKRSSSTPLKNDNTSLDPYFLNSLLKKALARTEGNTSSALKCLARFQEPSLKNKN